MTSSNNKMDFETKYFEQMLKNNAPQWNDVNLNIRKIITKRLKDNFDLDIKNSKYEILMCFCTTYVRKEYGALIYFPSNSKNYEASKVSNFIVLKNKDTKKYTICVYINDMNTLLLDDCRPNQELLKSVVEMRKRLGNRYYSNFLSNPQTGFIKISELTFSECIPPMMINLFYYIKVMNTYKLEYNLFIYHKYLIEKLGKLYDFYKFKYLLYFMMKIKSRIKEYRILKLIKLYSDSEISRENIEKLHTIALLSNILTHNNRSYYDNLNTRGELYYFATSKLCSDVQNDLEKKLKLRQKEFNNILAIINSYLVPEEDKLYKLMMVFIDNVYYKKYVEPIDIAYGWKGYESNFDKYQN